MHIIGVPKEKKILEKRVGLTPQGVSFLKASGFEIFVEKDAGIESGFLDFDYQRAGAKICENAEKLYQASELIVKVKEPQPSEYAFLRKEHVLFCFLHLASGEACSCVKALVDSGATAIGFETLEIDGKIPLLIPMSEIAGGLAFSYGAFFLSMSQDTKPQSDFLVKSLFRLATAYPNFESCGDNTSIQAIVWGGGIAGEAVLKMAVQSKQTKLVLVEPQAKRRDELNRLYGKQMDVDFVSPEELTEENLSESNLWIGCVHRKGDRAMKVVSEAQLEEASKQNKKVIVDIAIDQGGNFPESKTTYYNDPAFADSFGNQRFCVANIPSFCGEFASRALEKIALPFIEFLAYDAEGALERNEALRKALNVKNHKVMNEDVKRVHQLD